MEARLKKAQVYSSTFMMTGADVKPFSQNANDLTKFFKTPNNQLCVKKYLKLRNRH